MFARRGTEAEAAAHGTAGASPGSTFLVVNQTRGTIVGDRIARAAASGDRRKGLLGRDHLISGEGLWIIPCEGIHTFGMKFAIDVIYLDRRCRIRKIVRRLRPWRASLCLEAYSVLELAAGRAFESLCKSGDSLRFIAEESTIPSERT